MTPAVDGTVPNDAVVTDNGTAAVDEVIPDDAAFTDDGAVTATAAAAGAATDHGAFIVDAVVATDNGVATAAAADGAVRVVVAGTGRVAEVSTWHDDDS